MARASIIELRLPDDAGAHQLDELGAFARYCVIRIEQDLGECEQWSIAIRRTGDRYASTVAVHCDSEFIETTRRDRDAALATWDAFEALREQLSTERVVKRSHCG